MARFSNSDPEMIKFMMKFFKKICHVPSVKFRGHIHIYAPERVPAAERYWSAVTGIPRKQFFKTYSKPSIAGKDKRHTLPNGTFDIYICDTKLFLTIMGWIKGITQNVL